MQTVLLSRPSLSLVRGLRAFIASAVLLSPLHAWADPHTAGTPQLSSNPGAAYTIYLDLAGFNYTGMWADGTPGSTPAYAGVAADGSSTPSKSPTSRPSGPQFHGNTLPSTST